LGIRNESDCDQSLIERQRRVFHDGADLDGQMALGVDAPALPDPARPGEVTADLTIRQLTL